MTTPEGDGRAEGKTLDDYFSDWEGYVFGFGYGTGEPHILPALKSFLALCPAEARGYDYRELERELTPVVAWLLINRLAAYGVDILEYGTSPRTAWLTKEGRALKAYVDSKTSHDLIELANRDQDYTPCYPDACNCGPEGYDKNRVCDNPFWTPLTPSRHDG